MTTKPEATALSEEPVETEKDAIDRASAALILASFNEPEERGFKLRLLAIAAQELRDRLRAENASLRSENELDRLAAELKAKDLRIATLEADVAELRARLAGRRALRDLDPGVELLLREIDRLRAETDLRRQEHIAACKLVDELRAENARQAETIARLRAWIAGTWQEEGFTVREIDEALKGSQ